MKINELTEAINSMNSPDRKKELMSEIWDIIDSKYNGRINDEIIGVACNKIARHNYKQWGFVDLKDAVANLKHMFNNRSDGAHRFGKQYFDNNLINKLRQAIKLYTLSNRPVEAQKMQDRLDIILKQQDGLKENASGGGTSSGSVASGPSMGLGAGDPAASIYSNIKKHRKQRKKKIITGK